MFRWFTRRIDLFAQLPYGHGVVRFSYNTRSMRTALIPFNVVMRLTVCAYEWCIMPPPSITPGEDREQMKGKY